MDLPRARQGGLAGGLFAVYPSNPPSLPSAEDRTVLSPEGYEVTMAPALEYDYAFEAVQGMIGLLEDIETDSRGELEIVKTYAQLEILFDKGCFCCCSSSGRSRAYPARSIQFEGLLSTGYALPGHHLESTQPLWPGSPV